MMSPIRRFTLRCYSSWPALLSLGCFLQPHFNFGFINHQYIDAHGLSIVLLLTWPFQYIVLRIYIRKNKLKEEFLRSARSRIKLGVIAPKAWRWIAVAGISFICQIFLVISYLPKLERVVFGSYWEQIFIWFCFQTLIMLTVVSPIYFQFTQRGELNE